MSKYIYRNPLDQGYKQFKLTKKQHNKIFEHRQIKWHNKYEYYYNDRKILLYKFYNWKVIIFSTIIFPIFILIGGLINFKEIIDDYKRLYNQKKYGSFSSDSVENDSNIYNEVMKIIL